MLRSDDQNNSQTFLWEMLRLYMGFMEATLNFLEAIYYIFVEAILHFHDGYTMSYQFSCHSQHVLWLSLAVTIYVK